MPAADTTTARKERKNENHGFLFWSILMGIKPTSQTEHTMTNKTPTYNRMFGIALLTTALALVLVQVPGNAQEEVIWTPLHEAAYYSTPDTSGHWCRPAQMQMHQIQSDGSP